MALRKIHKQGEPVLTKKARPVTKFDNRLAQLIGDMKETIKDANGVGLAAPQVGILKRVVLIDGGADAGVIVLINPEIVRREGVQKYYEGCLSYPGYYGDVGRPESVTIRAQNAKGGAVEYQATRLYAVACCHELDHLEGEMFMRKVKGPLYTLEEVKAMREKDKAEQDAAGMDAAGGMDAAAVDSGEDSPETAAPAEGYIRPSHATPGPIGPPPSQEGGLPPNL